MTPNVGGDPRVLAQREQRPAALRAHHAPVEPQDDGEEREAEVVVAPVGVEALGLRRRLALAAAGELLDLEDVLLGHEAVGQRDQREVEAGDPQRHAAEDERLEPADRDGDGDADPERLALLGHHVGGGERADADERLVAERDLPDVAEQHVERQADDPVDHRLASTAAPRTPRARAGTRAPPRRARSRRSPRATHPSTDGRNGCGARRGGRGLRAGARRRRSAIVTPVFPSRPWGRTISTTSSTTKTSSVPGEPGMSSKIAALVATASTTPTMIPPRNAPGRLVMPPSTAAVNAGMRNATVITPGANPPPSGTASTPASPPSSAASAHVSVESRGR